MALGVFFKGLIIGFAVAAPVGPIGVLCIRRSLAEGREMGLATGLGAAAADAFYGGIAAFGLTAISNLLVGQRFWLGLLGGLFLCYLGIRTFTSEAAAGTAETRNNGSLLAAFVSTFFLTITNPTTILSFVAVFAAFGLAASPTYLSAATLVLGVFFGSAAWWLLLSTGVALFRSAMGPDWIRTINRLSGIVIIAFGLYSLAVSLGNRS